MSDEAQVTETAAPAAEPVAVQETNTTGPTTAAPVQRPVGQAASRRAVLDAVRARTDAINRTDANGRIHAEDGKFVPTTQPANESAAPEPSAATQPEPEATQSEPQAQPATVRIDLPDDHPLRAQGVDHIEVNPAHERAVRAVLNNPVRRAEVEQERAQREQTEQRALRAEKQAEAYREQLTALFGNPAVIAQYEEIKAWNPDAAEVFMQGQMARLQEQVATKVQEGDQEFAVQQAERVANDFRDGVLTTLVQANRYEAWPPHVLQQRVDGALEVYAVEVRRLARETGRPLTELLNRNSFITGILDNEYRRDPAGQAHLSRAMSAAQQAAQQRIRTEAQTTATEAARTAEQQKLQEAATRHATKPPVVPAGSSQMRSIELPDDLKGLTADQKRKAIRQRITQAIQR